MFKTYRRVDTNQVEAAQYKGVSHRITEEMQGFLAELKDICGNGRFFHFVVQYDGIDLISNWTNEKVPLGSWIVVKQNPAHDDKVLVEVMLDSEFKQQYEECKE